MEERREIAAGLPGEREAEAYVALCERLLGICESATSAPVKQGVQPV